VRVLLGIQYYYPLSNGGTELYVSQISKELSLIGHTVAILKTGNENDYIHDGIQVFVIPEHSFQNLDEDKNNYQKEVLNQFESILDLFKPDIFHLHTLHAYLNAHFLKIASKKSIKCVFTAHLPGIGCPRGDMLLMGKKQCDGVIITSRCLQCALDGNKKRNTFFLKNLLTFIYSINKKIIKRSSALQSVIYTKEQMHLLERYTDLIITPSEWQKSAFIINRFNCSKQKVVRLGVSEIFLTKKKTANDQSKNLIIGFIGRNTHIKGLHILLQAIKESFLKDVELHICLSISEEEKEVESAKMDAFRKIYPLKIFYNLPKIELIDVLDNCDVLCVPSMVAETGPYVVYEALSRGVPVVGSDIGGIKEVIKDGINGLLFKTGSISDLTKKLNQLANDSFLTKLKTNAYYNTSESVMASEIISLYKAI
jgi:glycosyltransferase involved in cell wall biosynthesis